MRMPLGVCWAWDEGRRGGWGGREIWFGAVCVWLIFTAQLTILSRYHKHPVLTQSCYQFDGSSFLPKNLCCRLHNYTMNDITKCVLTATNDGFQPKRITSAQMKESYFHSPNQYLLSFHPDDKISTTTHVSTYERSSKAQTITIQSWKWVIVGDSRIRQVFSALVTRLASPRLRYRKPSTMGKWRSIHELTETLRIGKLHEDIEVYHKDIPFNITFYWDPLLLRLAHLIINWTRNSNQQPTMLLIGSGLHWMRRTLHTYRSEGATTALDIFQQHMNSLHPHLASLAASTHTIIQLLDYIQESEIFSKYEGIYSNANIDLYNKFLSTYTTGTNIIPWNSNLPFSHLYHTTCLRSKRNSYDMWWNCDNPLHTGYIMIEEYANMLLNDICNSYLNLDHRYCMATGQLAATKT